MTALLRFLAPLLLIATFHPAAGREGGTHLEQASCIISTTQQAKIDALARIEKLVNHNPVPVLVGDAGGAAPIFDADYDWAEYRRAWRALRELAPDAETLWPELVKHLEDDRYCMTILIDSESTLNWTVGDVCHNLIADALSAAYYRDLKPGSMTIYMRMHRPEVARDRKKLKSWCEARSDKHLYALQIEMCEWVAEQLKRSDVLPRVSGSRRRAWIAAIEADIESLARSGRAVSSQWLQGEFYSCFSSEKAEAFRKRLPDKK